MVCKTNYFNGIHKILIKLLIILFFELLFLRICLKLKGILEEYSTPNLSASLSLLQIIYKEGVIPRRSIVFLWVTCEEIGMLGSLYYSNHPISPMEKLWHVLISIWTEEWPNPAFRCGVNHPKKVKDFNGLYTLANNVWPELTKISDEECAALSIVPDKSLPQHFIRARNHYSFH